MSIYKQTVIYATIKNVTLDHLLEIYNSYPNNNLNKYDLNKKFDIRLHGNIDEMSETVYDFIFVYPV